jgi:hypothetical protein
MLALGTRTGSPAAVWSVCDGSPKAPAGSGPQSGAKPPSWPPRVPAAGRPEPSCPPRNQPDAVRPSSAGLPMALALPLTPLLE